MLNLTLGSETFITGNGSHPIEQITSISESDSDFPPSYKYSFSLDILRVIDLFMNCIVLQLLCALGIVGNLFNVIILTRHGFADTTNIVLTSLSCSDLLFSVLSSLRQVENILDRLDGPLSLTYWAFYTVYVYPWYQASISVSMCHVSVIAAERALAVCLPFRVSQIVTARRMKRVLVGVYVYIALLLLPYHLLYYPSWSVGTARNATYAVIHYQRFFLDHVGEMMFYISGLANNLTTAAPLFVVFACTSVIIVKISGSRKTRRLLTTESARRRDARVVKMLLTVCVIFLVVLAPSAVFDVYLPLGADRDVLSFEFTQVVAYTQGVLYQTSASVNFIIYVSTSSKFARTYRKMLSCK